MADFASLNYWIALILNSLSVIGSLWTLYNLSVSKRTDYRHFSLLSCITVFHIVYNVASNCYCFYVVFIAAGIVWNEAYIFWSCSIMYASALSILFGNICIVLDRLLAIYQPVNYNFKYHRICSLISLIAMFAVLVAALTAYKLALIDNPDKIEVNFAIVVDFKVIIAIYIIKCAFCVLNMPLTGFFLWKFRQSFKRVGSNSANLTMKKANTLVLYQMLAETVIIVIPTIITTIMEYGFGITLPMYIGDYPMTLFSVYTAVCTGLLLVKMRRSTKMQHSNVTVRS